MERTYPRARSKSVRLDDRDAEGKPIEGEPGWAEEEYGRGRAEWLMSLQEGKGGRKEGQGEMAPLLLLGTRDEEGSEEGETTPLLSRTRTRTRSRGSDVPRSVDWEGDGKAASVLEGEEQRVEERGGETKRSLRQRARTCWAKVKERFRAEPRVGRRCCDDQYYHCQ